MKCWKLKKLRQKSFLSQIWLLTHLFFQHSREKHLIFALFLWIIRNLTLMKSILKWEDLLLLLALEESSINSCKLCQQTLEVSLKDLRLQERILLLKLCAFFLQNLISFGNLNMIKITTQSKILLQE